MKITKQRLKEIIKEELSSEIPGQRYIVNIELGEFSAPSLDAAIETARNWQKLGHDFKEGTSPEVLDALGLGEEEPLDDDAAALVLKGPKFDPLGSSPEALRQRASVRRGGK